jgi:cell division protein FtsI (penicillin-binding protein 3)
MKDIKRDILWRVYLVYFVVLAFAIAIIGRASYIQFALKDELLKKAKEQEIKYFPMEAMRGNILARDGSLLAASIPDFEIRMDLSSSVVSDQLFNSGVDELSRDLADLFDDKSPTQYKLDLLEARRDGNRYFLVKNHVKYDELKRLKTFPILKEGKYRGGFIVIRKTTRELPYKELARRTIGFENQAESLYVGLEGAYSDQLKGTNGLQLKRRISNGEWIPVNDNPEVVPQDGHDIVTTIDINIQDLAESSLARHLEEHQAFQGCAILMEVKTGEIRAIVNLRFDAQSGEYRETYNYAIGEAAEPGSTFKLASLIAAIEKYNISLDDYYFVGNGQVQYHGKTMEDVHHPSSTYITVQEIFEQSSNVGVSQIITKSFDRNPEEYVDMLRKMSLGVPLGVEIPGEGKPVMKDPLNKSQWYGTSLPWMSIGYEVTMTPLQILTFYNAVANDGVMVKPMFVSEIKDGGTVVKKFEPVVLNPAICSESTVKKAQALLEGVVQNGTGHAVKDSVYRVAGKTGTALVAQGSKGYADKIYNASFAGYFPADNPKYSCIVVVNRPESGKIYGGTVAAPVFKEIADKVYATQLDIHDNQEKTYTARQLYPASATGYFPELKVSLQSMSYAVKLPTNGPIWVETDTASYGVLIKPKAFGPDTMPNLTGMTAKDAVYMLEEAGIAAIVQGKGLVSGQSVAPGAPLVKGSDIVLTLQQNLAE